MAKFNELPFIARFTIFAIVGAAIFAGAWYGPVPGFEAMRAANNASIARLKALEAENARMRPYESQLKEIELQIESLQRQMERQKQIVPDQKTADQFMRDLQQNAQQAGVEIRDYLAKPIAQKQYYTEVPFDLEIDGPYFSMLNFFERDLGVVLLLGNRFSKVVANLHARLLSVLLQVSHELVRSLLIRNNLFLALHLPL